ncbi:uncharacterized protein LODBEIA_P41340 [Lodderomyces beijingensis]|uniref:INO80 complex subunit B-like conserved region domain-containing protein n=1 Tax=Lodderomyces beijingensis TaxID=1775926 RepID=A0ABP0ZP23_9ASCO
MDENDFDELSLPLHRFNKSKVVFKKKTITKSPPSGVSGTRKRRPVFEEEEDKEETEEEDDERIDELARANAALKTSTAGRFKGKEKPGVSTQTTTTSKRRMDLSRYMSSSTPSTNPLDPQSSLENIDGEELSLLEFDEDDPENNPVIANLEEFDILQLPPPPPPPSLRRPEPPRDPPKKYVPIETNSMLRTSKRQYLTDLGKEYQDERNYDDGTGDAEPKRLDELNRGNNNNNNDDDVHAADDLSDTDMGVLQSRGIDFENKFNREIASDIESDDETPKLKVEEVKIYTAREQIERIGRMLEIAKRRKEEVLKKRADVLRMRDAVRRSREDLIRRLNSVSIE